MDTAWNQPVEKDGNSCAAAPRHLAPLLAGFSAAVLILVAGGAAYQANARLGAAARDYRSRGVVSGLVQRLSKLSHETNAAAREFVLDGHAEAKAKLAALSRDLKELAADAERVPVIDGERRAQLGRLAASVRELSDCAAMLGAWSQASGDGGNSSDNLAREAGATYLLIDGYVEQLNTLSASLDLSARTTSRQTAAL